MIVYYMFDIASLNSFYVYLQITDRKSTTRSLSNPGSQFRNNFTFPENKSCNIRI